MSSHIKHNDCEESLEDHCRRALRRLSNGSTLFDCTNTQLDEVCDKVQEEDITVGNIIGKGCFSSVREMRLCDSNTRTERSDSVASNDSGNNQICGYAVKKLRDDLSKSKNKNGAIDLAVEAQFLKALSHPNIVSFHGIGASPGNKDFFIIIEQLDKTLDSEIKAWQYQKDFIKADRRGPHRCCFSKKREPQIKARLEQLFKKRISVAHQLASAMKYLHSRNILYRDLKPSNVGVDHFGIVKVFDFGLAKELKEECKINPDQYRCTIKTGTLRYMSPEVYNGTIYGLPADVYSFSIMLWELLSLDIPFFGFSTRKFAKKVIVKKHRPIIFRTWPKELRTLLCLGWSHDPSRRPRMNEIYQTLGSYLIEVDELDRK